MVERVRGLERARAERAAVARSQVIDLARSGVAAQREIDRFDARPAARGGACLHENAVRRAGCNQILTDLTSNVPWMRRLGRRRNQWPDHLRDRSAAIGLNISDRPYFQSALHSREFALSDYLISRVSSVPGVMATFPVMKEDGIVTTSVIVASIDLRWIGELAAMRRRRPGTAVSVIDGGGTLLAGFRGAGASRRQKFCRSRVDARNMLAKDEGTMTANGFDGVRRIFGFVRVPWTRRAARRRPRRSRWCTAASTAKSASPTCSSALFGMLVLLAAWFGGEQLILRPIRSLARTAARFGRGDLQARAADEPWLAEFEPLAAALDDMARKLAAREEELQIANQHLEELASLDGLTGLANRRGFDRELESRLAARRRSARTARADDDRYRSLQAVQ